LLGGNASGKSTTMKVILGLVTPRSGTVTFRGECIDGRPASQVIPLGVGSVSEARRIFPLMTVRENLLMGAYPIRPESGRADLEWMPTLFPRVAERLNQRGGVFSGGEQQMLAMARALMGRPRLICMDAPTMGLSPLYVDRVLEVIAEINREGHRVHGRVECKPCLADRARCVLQTGALSCMEAAPSRATLRHSRAVSGPPWNRLRWRPKGGRGSEDKQRAPAYRQFYWHPLMFSIGFEPF
jgi:ABC-type branched-subunit amino acid transport system ATPase component